MKKKGLLIVLLIMMLIIAAAPQFLLYSTRYEKTDAVVLFLGPDFSARQKEAYKIIKEGKADYLIIPAYNRIYRASAEGTVKPLPANASLRNAIKMKIVFNNFPYFYEDTHREAIIAKTMMSAMGLKSAIFVSSPYHMRRVKLIATNVFAGGVGALYFVPTSFEKAPACPVDLSWTDWKKVRREYGKIIWFSLYIHWPT